MILGLADHRCVLPRCANNDNTGSDEVETAPVPSTYWHDIMYYLYRCCTAQYCITVQS
jgi:hypothetical protein